MAKIKLVKQLFSKNDAKAVAAFEREQARKNGRSFKKVSVMNAMELYRNNKSLFDGMGKPWDEDYVVVVFYSMKDECGKAEQFEAVAEVNEVKADRAKVMVNNRPFIVIKYTTAVHKGNIEKVIERYVVLDSEVKENRLIRFHPKHAIAS